ncbi:MAG: hypothetical protein EOP24_42040 [Hyphomicrobiales bacterium]|nr:MAG: hypothetical protein EOP24_42040 [Hyphomicrobiales bacterium]
MRTNAVVGAPSCWVGPLPRPLAGVTVGLLPMLVLLHVVFTATVGIAVEWAEVLVLYAGSAVLAYGCALLVVCL